MRLSDALEIKKRAKELGLGRPRDPVKAIRDHCHQEVEKIRTAFGPIRDLNHLLEVVATSLDVRFEEIHTDHELQALSERYLSRRELAFGLIEKELDEPTDAVLIHLRHAEEWERDYVAVIDCRGYKAWRAYFSKWHEIAHRLSDPPQLKLSFRRTPSKKRDPIERLVDRIAGYLAFLPDIFLPALLEQLESSESLTFEIVENLRTTVCYGSSREATIRGAVPQCPHPQLFVIADYGLKKSEERALKSGQSGLFPEEQTGFEPKLRAIEVAGNKAASKAGLWIHPNMEVPEESVITEVYEDPFAEELYSRTENLSWWKHSRGRLNDMPIRVYAVRYGNRAYVLISPWN